MCAYTLTHLVSHSPVMAILHDHLEVPSSTACSTAFMFSRCALAEMLNTVLDTGGGGGDAKEEGRKSSTRHDMTLMMRNRVLRAKKWLWHVSTINDGDGQRRRRRVVGLLGSDCMLVRRHS